MKILTKVVLSIVLIILIGAIVLAFKAESILRDKAEDYIATLTNDKYELQFAEANINYLTLGVEIQKISIKPIDSTYIIFNASPQLITFSADKIDINKINVFGLLFDSEPRFQLTLTHPRLMVHSTSDVDIKTTELKKGDGKKSNIFLKSLDINDGYVNYITDTLKLETKIDYEGKELNSKNIENDLKSSSNLRLKNVNYETANGLHKVEANELNFDKKGELTLLGLRLITVPDKYELGHILGHEATWHDIKIDSIKANNPNSFFDNDTIKVSSLEISGFEALMFRDKRLKFPNLPDKPMIKEIINKIKVPLVVNQFSLNNGQITYQEHVKDMEDAGGINFEKLTVHGKNLSTVPTDVDLEFNASAVLMGKGLLEIEGTVPQSKNSTTYFLKGVIYPHDLKIYNPMLNYVAGAHVSSGQVKKSSFNFTYDNVSSKGTLNMIYDDLNVKFTNSEGNVSKNKLDDKLKNFFANTFVIKSDNEKGDDLRVGKIDFERNPKKSFLNYWWKSLLSGIKSSIGMKAEKETDKDD